MRNLTALFAAIVATTFCVAGLIPAAAQAFQIKSNKGVTLQASRIAEFDEPWAMTFLPDGTMLVTTKPDKLFHVTQAGDKTEVEGMWEVAYGGQGGLGDVVLHPDFAQNNLVYLSNAETLDNGSTFGAIVTRAKLDRSAGTPKLTDKKRIWTQEPKVPGRGLTAIGSLSVPTACSTSRPANVRNSIRLRVLKWRWAKSFG